MFEPLNRYTQIVLAPENPNETSSGILLPQDFKPLEERYVSAEVVTWASDVRFAQLLSKGERLLIDKSMVEEVTIDGEVLHLILDNYVLGLIKEE
jgi:co-chaperonin GroES (HSP10)